jgi:chromosomal replication initiation ATPase DnaA
VAQLVLPLGNRAALGREDFIVAPGNHEAVAFIDAWPDWPQPAAALYGPASSGKSHLAAIWAQRAGARIVEAKDLDYAVLAQDGALAVENVDGRAEDSLLFSLIERGRPLLLSGRAPPAEWPTAMPDLASRYRAMLAFALWAPNDALLTDLAKKLFADRQIAVPDAAIAPMIRSLERSPAAIRAFVARADEEALSRKRPITPALIREILSGENPS